VFKGSTPRANPAAAVKSYDKLNDELLDTKDYNHHGYVVIYKTDIVLGSSSYIISCPFILHPLG
jgi:hypothetical protein